MPFPSARNGWRFATSTIALVMLATGCTASASVAPTLLQLETTRAAFHREGCDGGYGGAEPDLMAWDPGSRARLGALQSEGIVAVRYRRSGCDVELELLNCIARGTYTFRPHWARDTKVMRSQRDLMTALPLGAATLGGRIAGGRALLAESVMAGVVSIPAATVISRRDLHGPDCAKADHVVASIAIGGFTVAAGGDEVLSGGGALFGAGVTGSGQRISERIAEEGDAAACARARQSRSLESGCDVALKVALMPVVRDTDDALR